MTNDTDVKLHLIAGSQDAAVDVIFFHGLGGHYQKTWTNDNGFYWPQQLHAVLPSTRVWAIQYPSEIFCWTQSGAAAQGNTETLAQRVWTALKAHSDSQQLMQPNGKPCVWVCHSLGGLIAKHVLLKNKTASHAAGGFDDARLQGILFLGTPHRGSSVASKGTTFFSLAKKAIESGEEAAKLLIEGIAGTEGFYRACLTPHQQSDI